MNSVPRLRSTRGTSFRTTAFLLAFGLLFPGAGFVLGQGGLPAFPGAQGFGRFATGGRGGSVWCVTNLNDSGPGSFRDAVSQPNRTVVFAVSGVIDYQSPRYNIARNVTIAGQTAPGDGVVLYGDGIGFTDSHNTITRFIRFRMGHSAVGEDTVGIARGHDMIFDHISATWSLDEVFSISGDTQDPTNITIQASIIGQGLQDHSAGGLIQTDGGVSILRCLYIDNGTRNPKVKGVNEFVNNVVYNWEVDAYILGDSAGLSFANVINNYFINGPGTGNDDAFSRGNLNFKLYASNNWQDKNRNGILDGVLLTQSDYDVNDWQVTPFPYPIAVSNALPPLTAVKLALSDVGPSWRRDAVDERLITELTSWGTLGETIFTEFDPPMSGPGPFKGGPVPLDTDQDGMPDYWEAALGTATNAPNHNDPSPAGSGYTRLEDYLNWLAEPHGVALTNTTVDIDLRQFTRGFLNTSPVYSLANVTNGTVTLLDGHIAHFVPATNLIGPAGFQFTVLDAQGSALTRPINLFFTPQPPPYGRLWRGDGAANNWDVDGDFNWFDEQALLYPFQNGDAVGFDDTGSTNPAVNLVGSLQPSLITANSSQNYTFSGDGSLDGNFTLNKTGSGILTLANTNNGFGTITVSNGTLLVNGTLSQSVVEVRSGATVGGRGRFGSAVVLDSGATLAPGEGVGSPGTLIISNGLSLGGGVTLPFDLSNDPSGTVKTNDRLDVANGSLLLNGTNTIQVNLLDGPLENGLYTLITFGAQIGSISSLKLVGANGVLTNLPNGIGILVDNSRAPTNLVWAGNGVDNLWDTGTTPDWMNGPLPDWFYFGDTVTFNDSGSTNPPVNISGTVSPAHVTVDATKNYTFSGLGKITGTGGLTRTNSGTLTISSVNDYTGVTTIAGGVLAVAQLPNGGVAGSIGAAGTNPANLVLNGGALRITGGSSSSDHGATFGPAGATLDIASAATTFTLSGALIGSGALTKAGSGRLDLNAINSYAGGTVVKAGDLRMVNTACFGSGAVTLNGTSNSATFRFGDDTQTLPNKLTVTGTNNFVLIRGNNTLSQVDGNGTFQGGLVDSGTTLTFEGGMSAFSGTVRAGTVPNLRFNPSTGSAAALFDLGTGSCYMNTRNGNITVLLGALAGGNNTELQGARSADNPTTFVVGGKNIDTTFQGLIRDWTSIRLVNIVKTGTGTWTLTHANTYTGTTTVNGGTLLVNNSTGSGTGSNSVTINTGGTLGGTGFILGAVTINAGATLAPGASVGTLTLRSSLTLNSSAILRFELGLPAVSDRVVVSNNLALGGTLNLTNVAGFGPGTYTLFNYGGVLSGALPTIGTKPSGFTCTVNTNTPGQVRLSVQLTTPPLIQSVTLTNNNIVLSGSGGPSNSLYYVLSSTNVALPLSFWSRVATNQFTSTGSFIATNAILPGRPQQFYLLQLP